MGIEHTNQGTSSNREDPEGEAARKKRDGFHLTQKGQEKDQLAFEQARRNQDRSEGREPTLYSVEATGARRRSGKQLEFQANERDPRNRLMKWLSALRLAPPGITAMDILKEEAERINQLVDEKVARDTGETSPQEAADAILKSEEFRIVDPTRKETLIERQVDASGRKTDHRREYVLPGVERTRDRIEFKEFLRSIDPELERSIEAGDLSPARELINQLKAESRERGEDREYGFQLTMGLHWMIADKIDTMVKAKDIPGMTNLLSRNPLDDISLGSLVTMPSEVLSLPEVKPKILYKLHTETGYQSEREKLSELIGEKGLISEPEEETA
jgi:hypothetical protein